MTCCACAEILCGCSDFAWRVVPAVDQRIHPEGDEKGASVRHPLLSRGRRHRRVVNQSIHTGTDAGNMG